MKKERKYNGLRKSAEQSPVSTMLIVLLLAAGIFLFPVEDMMRLFTGRYGLTEELAGTMAVRYLFAAVIVKLAYDFGFERLYQVSAVLTEAMRGEKPLEDRSLLDAVEQQDAAIRRAISELE